MTMESKSFWNTERQEQARKLEQEEYDDYDEDDSYDENSCHSHIPYDFGNIHIYCYVNALAVVLFTGFVYHIKVLL